MMAQIEDLTAEYKLCTTHREKALIESQIWDLVPQSDRVKGGIGVCLSQLLTTMSRHITLRHTILLSGSDADAMWPLLDDDMPIDTAARILTVAKRRATKDRIGLAAAIQNELEEYMSLSISAKTRNGKVVRRRATSRLRKPEESRSIPSDSPQSQSFWNQLRSMVSDHVNGLLADCDPMLADRLRKDLEVDLNAVITVFQDRICRLKSGSVVKIKRSDLVEACRVLGMDPPAPGKSVPPDVAKRQWRTSAKVYHPDAHNGNENTRPLFEAAKNAYELIEMYNESRGAHANIK
jgi:hypothetical protein